MEEKEKKSFYITTPIYYPSDKLHIGHTYCTVAADAMARYKRLRGYDVMFLTGSDEHGQKIERIAAEKGVTPKQYVDGIVSSIKDLWKLMNISNDRYIRTTDEQHEKAVQKIFRKMYDKGDIYKSEYEGLYCTPCEAFWTEHQLVDGKCPDCGRPVEKMKEESYFFRLSKYQDRIIDLLQKNPDFLQPASRRNEMLNNFLLPGLDDLCVSRTTFSWGIPVDFDPKHVVYVWIDALTNYITALGYGSENEADFEKFWPADVHLVGKEIVRFHSIIWPAMLMSLDLPLPKKIYGHGWLLFGGDKMSKSKGNVVDPVVLAKRYGVDSLRYFLLREMVMGSDGNFSNEALIGRINSDLANDLGNLLSRTAAMAEKYFGGTLPAIEDYSDDGFAALSAEIIGAVQKNMDDMQYSNALSEIWKLISRSNKYIDETMPWALGKDETKRDRLAAVLYNLCEALRIVSVMVEPFMPDTALRIREQLNLTSEDCRWEDSLAWTAGRSVTASKGATLFPRIDVEKELAELEKMTAEARAKAEKIKAKEAAKAEKEEKAAAKLPEIDIDAFMNIELRAAKVLSCEPVAKSDKLLKLQVDLGSEQRQVVSGIAQWYRPEDLVGRTVALVANLKPAKLRGVESQGMILAAGEDDVKVLFLDGVAPGTRIR